LIGKTPARYIDPTLAPDAETAEEQVAAPGRFKNFWKD